ncbi:uncharacterized protein N7443_009667 [Penicillium atrosanguineum]|uniref:PNPLA domain-containing protein n=1 Tax=Penicillium atrosanguineum TaxID=1132637 RepID=A0A9W9PRW0_9EURO|nr:uncharacterized protein N7443_009667 [Penicillium atrosanguineum]KAJ5289414.1 hypothetical protein N7443_009667 [Penicillium atrosanguineum]KAJ5307229.1 hypothetical protein N7476_007885 [Penicillium atrosanguineum]
MWFWFTWLWGVLSAGFSMILDVAQFWRAKLVSWWTSKSPRDRCVHTLATAQTYEVWEDAACELDDVLGKDFWRQNPVSRHYDYRLILGRLEALMGARETGDIVALANLLRSGLVRNLGNITTTKLFTHAYGGTKLLIDDYITQVALSIQYVTMWRPEQAQEPAQATMFTPQAKLELLHDTRQAFGRTTLLLQGGSAFGLCHLGVVKALHLQGLLPRIITGTATGAMIAALVGIHPENELLPLLDGGGIDLSVFDSRRKDHADGQESWFWILLRRLKRFLRTGHLFDMELLEECVRTNVGDLTFEEAYARSKRILNITVATGGKDGTPNLLNYLTAPNVLIWSAAAASNASSSSALSAPVIIYCKDETGSIVPWPHTEDAVFHPWRHVHYNDGESPLARIAELFNVNHFIVSQARPYLIPFLRSELNLLDRRQTGWHNISRSLMRVVLVELRHRLRQLDYIGVLPGAVSRLLIDETIPGPNLTLVPDLSLKDVGKLFQQPIRERVAEWTLKGERGVWPAVSALKVREAVEIELDRGYQLVRRRRPSDPIPVRHSPNEGVPRQRRGNSEGDGENGHAEGE